MLIPGLTNYILNENGISFIEDEEGDGIESETILYNLKFSVDGCATLAQMNIPDDIAEASPDILIEYVRESLLAYYATFPAWDQPENIFGIQASTGTIGQLNPDYNAPGWPYDQTQFNNTI